MPTTAFTDLDRAVDRLHAICDGWTDDGPIAHLLGADGMHVLRLTLHEWVANLVQHASFAAEAEIITVLEGSLMIALNRGGNNTRLQKKDITTYMRVRGLQRKSPRAAETLPVV